MTHLEKMAKPVTVTLSNGEWDVVLGQVTGEWSKVRSESDRKPYEETLQHIRQTIFRAQERP